MKKILPIIITGFSLIVGALGQVDRLWIFFDITADNIVWWKCGTAVLAGIYPVIVLPVQYLKLENRLDEYRQFSDLSIIRLRDEFIKSLKPNLLLVNAKPEVSIDAVKINIRVFTKVTGWGDFWGGRFFLNHVYIKNLKDNNLCNDELDDGHPFQVKPNPEGVVGHVYVNEHEDDDIAFTRNVQTHEKFKLADQHRGELLKAKFVAAVRIKNEKNNIICIVSIDSEEELDVVSETVLKMLLLGLGNEMKKYLPLLLHNRRKK